MPITGCDTDCPYGEAVIATRQDCSLVNGPLLGDKRCDGSLRARDWQPGDAIGYEPHNAGCPNHPSHRAACAS